MIPRACILFRVQTDILFRVQTDMPDFKTILAGPWKSPPPPAHPWPQFSKL